MGLVSKLGGAFMQGAMGNMNQMSPDQFMGEYGAYLMEGKTIQAGFKLVRDGLLITDKRILDFDKQGATGQKMRINSINLSAIYHVTAETSGFGLDDCELTIFYIQSPYYKSNNIVTVERTFEFPKDYDILALYKMLQTLAYENHETLNGDCIR